MKIRYYDYPNILKIISHGFEPASCSKSLLRIQLVFVLPYYHNPEYLVGKAPWWRRCKRLNTASLKARNPSPGVRGPIEREISKEGKWKDDDDGQCHWTDPPNERRTFYGAGLSWIELPQSHHSLQSVIEFCAQMLQRSHGSQTQAGMLHQVCDMINYWSWSS